MSARMGDAVEEAAKRAAGRRAVDDHFRDGMCVGLGTGSTAVFAIDRAVELARDGMRLRAVPTSLDTERRCREGGISIVAYGSEPIEVAIDGADEVAPDWSLTKGGGGALFREKAVALAARTFVVIVTHRKLVAKLGAFPLPVEVVPYSTEFVAHEIGSLGAEVTLRRGAEGKAFVTDNGNAILDCRFGSIGSPALLDRILRDFHGVVTTGIFSGLASRVLVGEDDGSVRDLPKP
jgi:ribose 5-phosphate isomerase A